MNAINSDHSLGAIPGIDTTQARIMAVLSTMEKQLIDLAWQRQRDLTPWFDQHRKVLWLLGYLLGCLVVANPMASPEAVLSHAQKWTEQRLRRPCWWFSTNRPLLLCLTTRLSAAFRLAGPALGARCYKH